MKHTKLITRLILGLILLIFGFNKFFHFIPFPPLPEQAGQFMGALASSGYIFPIVAIVEIGVGLLLISGRFIGLAAILLAPISINIILFHAVLDPAGIAAAFIVFALNAALLAFHHKTYRQLWVPTPA